MILPSDEKYSVDNTVEKAPPEVIAEEDVPFQKEATYSSNNAEDLSTEESIDTKLNWKKLSIGSSAFGWCIFLMLVCVILSMISSENDLIRDAFEAFKLIALTVMGYIFGSNVKK